jgi:hypothetical protein
MQVGYCFIQLVAYNTTVKTDFKMYCKHRAN